MKTVFILGAGASKPYGFPLGYELVDDVLKVLEKNQENFYHWGFDNKQLHDFKDAIIRSKPSSIDDLLVQRREFLVIGKLAIACALTQYEDERKLLERNIEGDWYSHFFEHVRNLESPVAINSFSFITFNYDRSLERFLDRAADSFFGVYEPAKKNAIQRITILHVHGSLGLLNSQGGFLNYQPTNDRSILKEMSENLRLTAEESDDKVIAQAHILIHQAERIRFLGFGYHQSNMQKLEFNANAAKCNDISGTCLGKSEVERVRLAKLYPKLHAIDHKNRNILQFFRESRPLD